MNAECPSCEDLLVGYTVAEAMRHLATCDTSPGWRWLGLSAHKADVLYESLTGEEPPKKHPFERMLQYQTVEEEDGR